MQHEEFMLGALAQIGALRKLTLSAIAMRLVEEPEPEHTLAMLGLLVTRSQTMPIDTGGTLDPAISDMLAAMTDEQIIGMVDELKTHLSHTA